MANIQNLTHNGRPKGAKNKFTLIKEQMLECFDLNEFRDWKNKHYTDYVKCMCSILPKDLKIEEENSIDSKLVEEIALSVESRINEIANERRREDKKD